MATKQTYIPALKGRVLKEITEAQFKGLFDEGRLTCIHGRVYIDTWFRSNRELAYLFRTSQARIQRLKKLINA